ncbi:MAG: hypothetical protein H0W72_07235 [Planctomycetes bacterium]|nr:hypothetical protein [Planctomycetota bacterium]
MVIEVELHTQGLLFDRRPADVIVAVDVSERQHAERELRRRSQDLARSNADLEQFASVAAHDLQEPLRMIDGHLHVILNNHSQGLGPRARQHLAFVVDAAARLRDMVRGVLVYARVPAHAAAFAPVDSAAAAWEALGFLRHAVDQSGASVSIVDLPKVNADFNQLRQLFQNLIGNAIKFAGGARPEVALRAEPWTDGCWRFTVSDQGIGIPAHQRERVFGLFQRLDNQIDGCGIGLATCRRIVERHGGRIWIEDGDHGTTVTFTLPGPTVVAKQAHAAESGGDYRA